jgi:group I intron endonuclease
MTWCIYKIENKINGKCYIGQTIEPSKRWSKHKYGMRRVKQGKKSKDIQAIHYALAKYGVKNFTFKIIEEVDTQEEANNRETYWVSYYNSLKNGYNCTKGGMNAPKTEEWKRKVKETRMKNGGYGKEWVQKIKETRMKNGGYGHSEETKKYLSDNWDKFHSRVTPLEVRDKLSKANKGKQNCLGHKQPQEVIEKRVDSFYENYGTKVCAVEGCDRTDGFKFEGVRYCDMHVERLKKHGTTDKQPHPKPTLGKKMSEETKQKISKNRKGKATGEANGFYGKKHSPEMIKYFKEINLGKEPPNKIKFSDDVILKIRNDSRSLRKIGADYGVSTTVIRRIKRSE